MAVTFDTLKFVDALEQVHVPREQARTIVRESHDAADVATKADLRLVRADVESLRVATKADMELLRKDIIIKLGGMLIAGFGTVIAVLFKLLG